MPTTATKSAATLDYFRRRGSPIVALATAPGGPVCVLRISGHSLDFLKTWLGPLPAPGTFRYQKLSSPQQEGKILDAALLLFFKTPHSFTGEDVLEIQGHGLESVVEAVLAACQSQGVQRALPGEFSFRALLNKRMTLAQAEALQAAFALEGLGADAASRLLCVSEKGVEKYLAQCLEALSAARGRLEAAIDFSEAEQEQAQDLASAQTYVKRVREQLTWLLNSYNNFCTSVGVPKVALVGPPNVGKSTLLNLLAGGHRALVSGEAGTTRDVIDILVRCPSGHRLRFLDTAGLRTGAQGLEAEGMELGQQAAQGAQLLVRMRSALHPPLEFQGPSLEIYSHLDKVRPGLAPPLTFNLVDEGEEAVRAVLEACEHLLSQEGAEAPEVLISKRQQAHLLQAQNSLEEAEIALHGRRPLELAANDLRDCEAQLRMALGQGVSDDYIGQIFSQFCLGK